MNSWVIPQIGLFNKLQDSSWKEHSAVSYMNIEKAYQFSFRPKGCLDLFTFLFILNGGCLATPGWSGSWLVLSNLVQGKPIQSHIISPRLHKQAKEANRKSRRDEEQEDGNRSSAKVGDCSGELISSLLPFDRFRGVRSFSASMLC